MTILGNRVSWTRVRGAIAVAVVVCLALFVRFDYVTTAVVYAPVRADAAQYYDCAWNLVHHGVFSMAQPGPDIPTPDSFREPALPALIAFWLWAAPDGDIWYGGLLLTQALLGALTVLFWMLIARRCLSTWGAIGVGLLAALWPHCIVESGYILTETLTGFFLAAGLWQLARAASVPAYAASGFFFSLASLSNAVFMPFPVLLWALEAWKSPWRRRLAVAFLSSSLLLPAAWTIRGAALANPSGSSAASKLVINLIQGSHPEFLNAYHSARVDTNENAIRILQAVKDEQNAAVDSPARGLTMLATRIAGSPMRYLRWYLIEKPWALWGWALPTGQGDLYQYPTLHSPFVDRPAWRAWVAIAHAINAPLALLMALGIALFLVERRKSQDEHAVPDTRLRIRFRCILLVLYVTAVYASLQAEPRYVIAIRGAQFILVMSASSKLAGALQAIRRTAAQSMNQTID